MKLVAKKAEFSVAIVTDVRTLVLKRLEESTEKTPAAVVTRIARNGKRSTPALGSTNRTGSERSLAFSDAKAERESLCPQDECGHCGLVGRECHCPVSE